VCCSRTFVCHMKGEQLPSSKKLRERAWALTCMRTLWCLMVCMHVHK